MRTARRQAFTLIELLVVISVIALLIGILVPALGAAIKSGRILTCTKNAKAINMGVQFYINVWKDTYPHTDAYDGGGPGSGTAAASAWMNLVGKKGKSTWTALTSDGTTPADTDPEDRLVNKFIDGVTDLAECPLDAGSSLSPANDVASAFDGWGSSYVYWDRTNSTVATGGKTAWDGVWAIEGHRAVEIGSPAKKLIVADMMALSPSNFHKLTGNVSIANRHRWHSDSDPMNISIAFADGHAKNMKRKTSGGSGSTGINRNPINSASTLSTSQINTMQLPFRNYTTYY